MKGSRTHHAQTGHFCWLWWAFKFLKSSWDMQTLSEFPLFVKWQILQKELTCPMSPPWGGDGASLTGEEWLLLQREARDGLHAQILSQTIIPHICPAKGPSSFPETIHSPLIGLLTYSLSLLRCYLILLFNPEFEVIWGRLLGFPGGITLVYERYTW